MVNASMEIGFIMAAMKDDKPTTAFLFPVSASNKKKAAPAKETPLDIEEEHRYSTDSESCLKGMCVLFPSPCPRSARCWRWAGRFILR